MKNKIINVRRCDIEGYRVFLKELVDAVKDGWEPDFECFQKSKPFFNKCLKIELFKVEDLEKQESVEIVSNDLSLLDSKKSSKSDLLILAESLDIEIPEDKKTPAAIRKFIKENLNLDK